MIDPDILEAMQGRGAERRAQATTPPVAEPPDSDLLQQLRARSGAAYAAGDDERASRLRRAAEILQGVTS